MIVAGGFVEVSETDSVEKIMHELTSRGIHIDDVETHKVIFLIKGETIDMVKAEINSLRSLDNVKNVHLTYYSLEHGEEQI